MEIKKYNISIEEAIHQNIKRLINQIYKLLPEREENKDWCNPLESIVLELKGMSILLKKETLFFSLLCKLEGLFSLTEDADFSLFRKTIFECLNLLAKIKESLLCGD